MATKFSDDAAPLTTTEQAAIEAARTLAAEFDGEISRVSVDESEIRISIRIPSENWDDWCNGDPPPAPWKNGIAEITDSWWMARA